ncbi:DUF3060 domain-containing protein [Mycobacterium sp. pR1184]|uniref:DUF3060 domain-containing protein n=1 Tax=Mycobacterium sp. pR1184 TaxID=3238981 RepID=UPI00351B99C8
MNQTDKDLAPPPRRVPVAFRLAELLPFRWWYVWTLLAVAIAPIVLWIHRPAAFAVAAVLTLAMIYAVHLFGARVRVGLLKWGRVATVTGAEKFSRAQHFNARLPMAHEWRVTRERWSGPNTTTKVSYTLDGHQGELVARGREYADGVILADVRNPARARCVTAFAYDLDRDQTGNWAGALGPRLRVRMVCWLLIVIGWLVVAGLAATGTRTTDLAGGGLPTKVPSYGTLQVNGSGTTKTIPCNGGYLSVSGANNTVTVTGHCTSLSVSGKGNRVTIDNTDAISTTGTDNVVTYHWGSPNVANTGTSNTVGQG